MYCCKQIDTENNVIINQSRNLKNKKAYQQLLVSFNKGYVCWRCAERSL